VLIKHDRVLVFDAYGSTDSYTQSMFMYDLEGRLGQPVDARAAGPGGALPYEFRALEAVLISVTDALAAEFDGVRGPVVGVLRELEEDIDRDKLRYLLVYSKKLGTFEQTARLVRDALEELLEADDDLAAMYLTAKAQGKGRAETEHAEIELLLESYHKVTNEIVQGSENLILSIRNTEEMYGPSPSAASTDKPSVKAILDANRNALMLLELRFSIWTLGLGAGTFLAALYGMNLKNFFEESDFGFGSISVLCAAASALVLAYGLTRLRRVQRLSMWGGGHCAPGGGQYGGGGVGGGGALGAPLWAAGEAQAGAPNMSPAAVAATMARAQAGMDKPRSLWGLGFGSGGRAVVDGQQARMAEKQARLAAAAMASQQAGRAVPLHERLEQQLRMDWRPAEEKKEK
jgi:magnesium transporter